MRIKDINAFALYVPLNNSVAPPASIPFGGELSSTVFSGYRSVIVKITTEDGLVGVGECLCRLAPKAIVGIIEDLKPLVIGQSPMDVEVIWEKLYAVLMNRGHNRGFFIEAISGIDIALWDLKAQILEVPLYHAIGGLQHPVLNTYAGSIHMRGNLDDGVAKAREYVSMGFKALKIKIGPSDQSPHQEVRLVGAIREAVGPGIGIMVDANSCYDLHMACRVAGALERHDLSWFEEPLPPDNLANYQVLAAGTGIPIAAGESEYTRWGHLNLLQSRAIKVLQPSACRTGGISETRRIAALSSCFRIPYVPHIGSASAVSMVVAMHLAASQPNFHIFEYMLSDWSSTEPNPLRWKLLSEPAPFPENGKIDVRKVLTKPGLGFQLNESVLDRWRLR